MRTPFYTIASLLLFALFASAAQAQLFHRHHHHYRVAPQTVQTFAGRNYIVTDSFGRSSVLRTTRGGVLMTTPSNLLVTRNGLVTTNGYELLTLDDAASRDFIFGGRLIDGRLIDAGGETIKILKDIREIPKSIRELTAAIKELKDVVKELKELEEEEEEGPVKPVIPD